MTPKMSQISVRLLTKVSSSYRSLKQVMVQSIGSGFPGKEKTKGKKTRVNSKMRNRGKDRIYHRKWAEIGKYVVKVVYFGTFSTNIAP